MSEKIIQLPVINERFLDEQLGRIRANQLEECKSSGCDHRCDEGRTCPQRIEYAGDEPIDRVAVALVVGILALIAAVVFSPEIAAAVYAFTN